MRQLILDANLLVLLIVGLKDPSQIAKHKRTRTFCVEDFELLRNVLAEFDQIAVTPNILTETSNLLRQASEPLATELNALLGTMIGAVREAYVPSERAARLQEFPRLGLTDAAALEAAGGGLPLLTADLGLYLAASARGLEATNFHHLRVEYLFEAP